MAGQPLATAYVRVRPQVDRAGFQRETERAAAKVRLDKAGAEAGKSFFGGFAKIATVGLGALGAVNVLKGFVSDAEDAEKVNKLLANTIKSTGDASKTTVGHLEDYANTLMAASGVNDEAIKSGEAMLLTFTNIKNTAGKNNDVFDQSTKAVLDMTAAMNGGNVTQENMRKTSVLVGKAINDPIKGLTALQRVGVTFTDKQKEQIKTLVKSGDTMGAQKLILHELGKEFGGAAAAMATPSQKLKTALGEIGENIGTALLPLISQLAGVITKYVLPKLGQFSDWFQTKAIPAISGFARNALPPLLKALGTLFRVLGNVIGFVARNREWILPLAAGFAAFAGSIMLIVKAIRIWREVQILLNIALTANPIGLIIAGIVALGAALYIAWTRSATFRKIVEAAWHGILVAVKAVASWFTDSFVPFFTETIPKVFFTAWHAVYDNFVGPLIDFFTKTIPHVFSVALDWLKHNWPLIVAILTGPIGIAVYLITKNWGKIWDGLKTAWKTVADFFKGLPGWFAAQLSKAATWLTAIGGQIIAGLWAGIKAEWKLVGDWWGKLKGAVTGFFAKALDWLTTAGKQIIAGLWAGLKFDWALVTSWFSKIKGAVTGFFAKALSWLTTAGKWIIDGLLAGLKFDWKLVTGWVGTIAGWFKTLWKGAKGAITWMVQAGKDVIQGLWNGLLFVWNKITGWIGGIAKWIKDHKGPLSLDRNLLVDSGKAIMHGLMDGLSAGFNAVQGFVGGIAGNIARGLTGPANVQTWIMAALRMAGKPLSWLPALEVLVRKESAGDPNAVNPVAVLGEHASGLWQMLPSTFAAFGGRPPGAIFAPVIEGIAALKYIAAVYGSPNRIPGLFTNAYRGYAGGGLITEPILGIGRSGRMYGFGERGPETVIPGRGGIMYAITVNVPPTANAAAVGGEVVRAIQAYEAGNGKRWRS